MQNPESDFHQQPQVKLVNCFNSPYDNAVAAARTCYSPRIIYADEVGKDQASRAKRDAISKSTFLAGHHTILQHSSFQFAIEKTSRLCIWSFLHSHPFYNSEQVSQRYVEVSPENFYSPAMKETLRPIYNQAVGRLMESYVKLQELIKRAVEEEYKSIFPNRPLSEKKWQSAVKKKCQEAARYVLPLAAHAHLYHTISGLTLLRYMRLCQTFDAPAEQKILVGKMAGEVRKLDPRFLDNAEDPLPLEETPEYRAFTDFRSKPKSSADDFHKEFDASLGGFSSLLVDSKPNSQAVFAGAVRNVLGLTRSEMDDASAIDLVLNPAKNKYLSETLNLNHHAKITRAMFHPHFTFRKKLSHSADSQDQRHRGTPGSRPVLSAQVPAKPDYITPQIISSVPEANELFSRAMESLWADISRLQSLGLDAEASLYLLPNAIPIRFEESGSLMDFHHKWVHRLCYTAQEEIWRNCLEEVKQVREKFPLIGKHIYAPCALRETAGRKPFCPEGDRYCGVPVWKLPLEDYKRLT